jgi:thiol:disulfide interchange protein
MTGKNMAYSFGRSSGVAALSIVLAIVASPALGQFGEGFGGLSGLGGENSAQEGPTVTASASATVDPQKRAGVLTISAEIANGWHIYSITQKPGGPLKSQIRLSADSDVELAGVPKALTKPEAHPEPAFDNLEVETHSGTAEWEVPIRLKPGADAKHLKIKGSVFAQACAESCLPPQDYDFAAGVTLKAVLELTAAPVAEGTHQELVKPKPVVEFRPNHLHASLRGWIQPGVARPGSTAELVIEATPDKDWHVYGLEDKPKSKIGARPTLIVFTDTSHLRYTKPKASVEPVVKPASGNELPTAVHAEPVQWTVKFEIPESAKPGDLKIEGVVGVQTCKSLMTCDRPTSIHFSGVIQVSGTPGTPVPSGLQLVQGKSYEEAAAVAEQLTASIDSTLTPGTPAALSTPTFRIIETGKASTLPVMIGFALLGGLILNLMPCVLPVIGLKILGFAQQAGQDRAKIFALNLWYAAGMLVVFLALATLAAAAQLGLSEQSLGWGQQFSSTAFNIVMASIVFTMALSFLGVWEIPIPGFVGSGKAQKLSAQEGASGAFSKGVLTTVLATPCSGPFLGPVFGFTLTQTPAVIYVLFTAIGLGMALPYLVIGAFPKLIAWLPKPGAWMDTFKQLMGFVMLGTVAFIFSFMQKDFIVPTFVLLIALWAACWWIGRTPTYEPFGKQAMAWLQGGVVAALIGWFAFTQLIPGKQELAWQPFDRAALAQFSQQGKTVLVDFSADWCATCKLNLKVAIDTPEVAKLVETNGVVPMLADWTNGSQEVTDMLAALGSNSIPVLAIFPADRPGEVIVLRDLVGKKQVLNALETAGPSRSETGSIAHNAPGGL